LIAVLCLLVFIVRILYSVQTSQTPWLTCKLLDYNINSMVDSYLCSQNHQCINQLFQFNSFVIFDFFYLVDM
jgi:hypothetical protein